MNCVDLVGRITKTPSLYLTENGKKVTMITLAIGRNFKNQSGEYDTDYLDCTLWSGIAETTAEYCGKGDIVGVHGRLQTRIVELEDGSKYKKMEIVANSISFISSPKSNRDEITQNTISDEDIPDDQIVNSDENVIKESILSSNEKNVDDLKVKKTKKK